jgi:iron complex outermembrane receptor protein
MRQGQAGIAHVAAVSGVALAYSLASAPAMAADPSGEKTGQVQEIIVTAQKHSESATRVPASLTVLTASAVEARQIRSLSDIKTTVPSLVIGALFGATQVSLRGISTGITSGAEDASVALHIDGVYQPRPRTLDLASIDLDRIEVLSGPQGTLYGRNATGGVVNYVLKQPSRSFEANIAVEAANYDRYQVRGAVSGPITENLQFRVSAIYDDQATGFVKNLQPNAPQSTLETNHTEGARVALAYQPSSTVSILGEVTVENYNHPTDFSSFAPTTDPFSAALFVPTTSRPHYIYNDTQNADKGRVLAPTFTVEWNPSGNILLKSITGYQRLNDNLLLDADFSGAPLIQNNSINRSSTWTQELDANIKSFGGRLNSTYGLFYFNDRLSVHSNNFYGFIIPGVQIPANYHTSQATRSYAAFMDHTYSVTSRLRLELGARYNIDEKNVIQTISIGGENLCGGANGLEIRGKWYSFTPKVSAQFDFNPHVMGYVQWQKGFKSGGVAADACGNQYNPEKIEAVEAGLKGTAFERRVTFGTAIYHYDVSDLQVQQYHNLALLVNNAGAAEITGFEISGTAILTDWLRVDLGANVQKAEYTTFSNCDPMEFLGACGAGDPRPIDIQFQDVSGHRLNRAPPYTINLGIEANHTFANVGKFVLRGELYWSGKVNFDEFGNSGATQSPYYTLNVFLNYSTPSDRYHVRLFGRNLTDTDYKTSAFGLAGAGQTFVGTWGPPRTYGVEVGANF